MKKLIAIFILIALSKLGLSQDIHFSQSYMTPLELNPATAGTEFDIRAILNYRTQWNSVSSEPYVTMMAGYDMNFKKSSKSGYFSGGIFLYNDKAGDSKMNQTNANLCVAYNVLLDDHNTLGLGVQGGYFQRSIDFSNLKWGSQYDGYKYDSQISSGETASSLSSSAPDFSSGIAWTYKKGERYMTGNDQVLMISGISIQHINKPKTELQAIVDDPLFYRWVGHVSGIVGVPNSPLSIMPSAVYLHQGSLNEIMLGANVAYRFKEASKYTGNLKGGAMGIGAAYRLKDAFIITSFLEISNYTIGISYDLNTSSLSNASKSFGAFEVALRYGFPNPFGGARSSARFK